MLHEFKHSSEKKYLKREEALLVLEFIKREFDLDFFSYSQASADRRITKMFDESGAPNVEAFIEYLASKDNPRDFFISQFTVNVTEMFRDPHFFRLLIPELLEYLKFRDSIKIWSAGCSSGEELLSLLILAHEHDFIDKIEVIGTDIDSEIIEVAKSGTYKTRQILSYATSYIDSGGNANLEDYFIIKGEKASIKKSILDKLSYKVHDLVLDPMPEEMFDLIMCRNTLIYFDTNLQNLTISKFNKKLKGLGYLCLGSKESILFFTGRLQFEEINGNERIFKKAH